jgi:type 1 glutamine amidotransferase
VLKVEDQRHPATRMLGSSSPLNEESYQFGTAAWDPRGGDYPQAWTREFGRGRVFYATRPRSDIWSHDAVFRAHVTGQIRWALGLEHRLD